MVQSCVGRVSLLGRWGAQAGEGLIPGGYLLVIFQEPPTFFNVGEWFLELATDTRWLSDWMYTHLPVGSQKLLQEPMKFDLELVTDLLLSAWVHIPTYLLCLEMSKNRIWYIPLALKKI
jgi:hypothetical protein